MLEYFDQPSLDLLRVRFPETPAAGAAILFEEELADPDRWQHRLEAAGALIEASWFATTPPTASDSASFATPCRSW